MHTGFISQGGCPLEVPPRPKRVPSRSSSRVRPNVRRAAEAEARAARRAQGVR